ncbi:MAG TPA: ornithine-acyl-ACP acyltransferase [Maritimibacter sp.]|nr:ornithine-acyl-ACP acyltransferase [Maritimibacter sp.]
MAQALLTHGGYEARRAASDADRDRAFALRYRAFVDPKGQGRERDGFDGLFDHVLIERAGEVVGTYRYAVFDNMALVSKGYSSQHYDLAPLARTEGKAMEMGRFCLAPEVHDADVLRVAWGAMAALVDRADVKLLFGCSSFPGVDPNPYHDAFALLARDYQSAPGMRVGRKSREIVTFPDATPDPQVARAALPPLLRTYLGMGGWVSDHAVVDRQMGTLHVFTGVEIDRVPPARARALRVLANGSHGTD